MQTHFNAHRPARFDAHSDRERRYPVLGALDMLVHCVLSLGVLILTLVTLSALLLMLMPDFGARVVFFGSRLLGI